MARKRRNPPALETAGWAAGAAVLSSAVTFIILREIFVSQVTQECFGAMQGAGVSTTPTKPALERRVRAIL